MNAERLVYLRTAAPRIGTWLSTGSPAVAELASLSGFDWLLIDLEHGLGSEAAVLPQLQAIQAGRSAPIVRVGAPHADLIARVLDWGADGIMVPHVANAEEAELCVQAMRYPPRGHRGYSRSVRAYGYGLRPATPEIAPFIFAQIETADAVENAPAIAQVDGVDALFVGPADLQFDLANRCASATRDYAACLREVVAAASAAGKHSGLLVRDVTEVGKYRDLGFTHLAIDSDMAILRAGYQRILTTEK